MRALICLLTILLSANTSASGEINVLTDLFSPFPPGCVAVELPTRPASSDNLLWDEIVPAPDLETGFPDSSVRVQIWRAGCADDGFSVVMVRLTNLSESTVLVPQTFVEAGDSDLPFHEAQLITQPAVGKISAAGNILPASGQTYMLAADPLAIDGETFFSVNEYNALFTLELYWGAFAPEAAFGELFPIFPYEPALDPPQFPSPVLHGRMSGSYTFPGIAASGLFLNIGELEDDSNFLFAAFFTYLDGSPVWLAGNTGGTQPGFDIAEIEMQLIEGGRFFTDPSGFSEEEVLRSNFGTLQIEALDCNRLLLRYDFSSSGQGRGELVAERFTRIAGYDCNPWN